MNSVQVYKLLTETVGKLNTQAVALGNGKIDKAEAREQATEIMTAAIEKMTAEEAAPGQ